MLPATLPSKKSGRRVIVFLAGNFPAYRPTIFTPSQTCTKTPKLRLLAPIVAAWQAHCPSQALSKTPQPEARYTGVLGSKTRNGIQILGKLPV